MTAPRLITTLALLLVAAPPALAVTLTTPLATPNDDQIADCIVTNIDTKTIHVSVELIGITGDVLVPTSDDCNNTPLGPRQSCQVLSSNEAFYCVVTTNGTKVRAGIAVFDPATSRINVYYPATK